METVTGIGLKKKDRWRRVASSIALVVQLTAMLEAWRVAFRGSNQPWVKVFHTNLPAQFFFFLTVKKPQNEKKVKKRSV